MSKSPQRRADMIAETRGKLIAAGRQAFATKGYAAASMDDLTAEAGLTRGALYHHFGDKKGLLEAVIAQIDAEMARRLRTVIDEADTAWDAFIDESVAWIEMALEPEIQRIVLLDGPAVLGDPSRWASQISCVDSTANSLRRLIAEGKVKPVDPDVAARLVNGAALSAALWIASAEDPRAVSAKAIESFLALASGLLKQA
ncbi:TetR/AcrR family transcriptional regulator [Acidisoma cellulosilyticum]|nr:TetR/AcrR family transcriptional regulator [Acidisoma cellulosilyticum]